MFYTFIPAGRLIKQDTNGRLLPQEYDCHIRSQLHSTLDQKSPKLSLPSKHERERTDVWWVEPDLGNAQEVVDNIREVFLSDGVLWYSHYSDLDIAYVAVKAEGDCLDKYFRAMYFAKHLGRSEESAEFMQLAKQEASRIRSAMPCFAELSGAD